MRTLIIICALLCASLVWAATEISVPVTINVGTTNSSNITIPANTTGRFRISIPCDPAWALQIYVLLSFDKGSTWDCDPAAQKCQGFRRDPTTCVNPDIVVTWTKPAAMDTKAVLRIQAISNLTKTVTITATWDP